MLHIDITQGGIQFSVTDNGRTLPFHEWPTTDNCIYYAPLSLLADNGYAQVNEAGCQLPFENIYELDATEQNLLGLPAPYDHAMRLVSTSMLNQPDFTYQVDFLTHLPDGDLIPAELKGNIVITNSKKYLLSESQYALVQKVNSFNTTPQEEKTTDFNLRNFAKIKTLAQQANCFLDSYLKNENVYAPDKIKLTIDRDDEGFTLNPTVDIEGNDKFQQYFNRLRKVQGQYPIQRENGERIRIVLNDKQRENLKQLKTQGNKHKTREEIHQIISQPTEYFDPDTLDFSELYSDRVIEIGVYKPSFSPFICPFKSCWITGATVQTPENGTSKIFINSQNELDNLKHEIQYAKDRGKGIVEYGDALLDIDDALFLADTAEKQLSDPKRPIVQNNEISEKDRQVLIIEDNAENLGFTTQKTPLEKCQQYTLYTNAYLQKHFTLKEHQKEGVAWLQHLYLEHANGCLMADDMGLGKTLQVLYFIDWHARKYPHHKPYLIVAPISLLENWQNEYIRFFAEPRMRIAVLSTREIPRQYDKHTVDKMQGLDIILTNYDTLRISQLNFCAVDFDIIALDEAQKIKSIGTLVTNAAKALKGNFKIAMTGTPVENSLTDLWCIMDFAVPGLLGSAKAFNKKYTSLLRNEQTNLTDLGNEIHKTLGTYFLRRLKKDVAKDLTRKIEVKEKVVMPPTQTEAYDKIVQDYTDGNQPNMLVTIGQLKEVSEHPYLYDATLHNHDTEDLIHAAARLQATVAFLDKIKQKNEKVIIFAERKEIQKMLFNLCLSKYHLTCSIINGDTPTIVKRISQNKLSRQACIDAFQQQEGFNIIIMSPKAAGIGLNITAANHVIHYSRPWNPAIENQATDRAYRIGQTKDVYVYYPLAVRTNSTSFDETLDILLERKNALASSTIFPTEKVKVEQEELAHLLLKI